MKLKVVRRFGDPDAPTLRARRWAKPFVIVVIVAVLVTAVMTTTNWVRRGDLPHTVGSVIGIGLAMAMVALALALWAAYWRPLKRAIVTLRRANSSALVIGARLPDAPTQPGTQIWSPEPRLASGRLVLLVADNGGLRIFNSSDSPVELARASWSKVGSVEVAECVEAKRAIEVIAILDSSERDAILLQAVDCRRWFVRFPAEKKLVEIVSAIRAQEA